MVRRCHPFDDLFLVLSPPPFEMVLDLPIWSREDFSGTEGDRENILQRQVTRGKACQLDSELHNLQGRTLEASCCTVALKRMQSAAMEGLSRPRVFWELQAVPSSLLQKVVHHCSGCSPSGLSLVQSKATANLPCLSGFGHIAGTFQGYTGQCVGKSIGNGHCAAHNCFAVECQKPADSDTKIGRQTQGKVSRVTSSGRDRRKAGRLSRKHHVSCSAALKS